MDSLRVCAQLRGIQTLEYVGIFMEMLENKKYTMHKKKNVCSCLKIRIKHRNNFVF